MNENARTIFKDNLKYYMNLRGLDQAALADRIGVAASTVSAWYNGVKYPRVDAMQRLADALGVNMVTLQSERSEAELRVTNLVPVRRRRIPVVGQIAAGQPIFTDNDCEEFIEADVATKCDVAIRVVGDSMVPTFLDGDFVLVRCQPDVDDGQIAAVIIGDEATLKHLYHVDGGIQLVSDNPRYKPMTFTSANSDYISVYGLAVAYQRKIGR